MEHRGFAASAIVLALVLAGCIGAASEESALPCSATEGSPAPAYDADALRAATSVRGFGLEEAQAKTMLALVAAHIVTPGGAPYRSVEAVLTREPGPADAELASWRFAANATWDGGVDELSLSLFQRGEVVGADFADDVVDAAGWLRAEATAVAHRIEAARAVVASTNATAATWFADAPGCVRLAYGEGAASYVWLDLARESLAALTDGAEVPGARPQEA